MANPHYDLVVIGSGPGGYVAAIRASQLKMKVAVVERDSPGGVCLNWGCIPSKALLNSAEAMETVRGAAKEHGIEVGEVRVDFKRVIARSRAAATKLSRGVRFLLRKNRVDLYEAEGCLGGPHTVELAKSPVYPAPSAPAIEADRILLATGSTERLLPGMTVGNGVLTSREALEYDQLPKRVVIVGAGAIGLEFGYFYRAFGTEVTIVELEPQMLPGCDAEVAEEVRRAFTKRGVKTLLNHGYRAIERDSGALAVVVESAGAQQRLAAEAVLVAVGRQPLSANLNLESVGVELASGGWVNVNERFQTTCPSVYAIGDLCRPPLLAHKASAEGIAAVEMMAGVREPGFDLANVPVCIYCEPEVAMVGISEQVARERGLDVKVGKFPLRANGKAVAVNEVEGFVKIVATREFGEVVGCQIVGPHATDLISEVVLGRALETTAAEIGRAVHPHPTFSEAIMEAALAAEGDAINI